MKHSILKKSVIFFVLLIISFGISLYSEDIKSFETLKNATADGGIINISQLNSEGYEKKGNVYTSVNNDAGFIAQGVNSYIRELTIDFDEPLEQDIEVQIYYSNKDATFTENTPASANAVEGQKSILLFLNDDVYDIRIDITTQPNQRFVLKEIAYNTTECYRLNIKNIIVRMLIIWGTFIFVAANFLFEREKFYKWLEKKRFLIGIAIVVFCIVFEIHGSSIAAWAEIMPSFADSCSDTLFGVPREIRTDEWATFTPMTISQSYGETPYSWFNNIVRGTRTDMFMVYAQPVFTPFIIFRPFLIGFLFFGIAKGLAFFWSARIVCLVLVSFEFFKMLSKNKKYAVAATLLIALAPLVQWWFAINGLVEMLIFAQLSLVMLNWYMKTDIFWKRCIALFVIYICAGGFILTLYPAWQIPVFYIILAVAIGIICSNFKGCKIGKKDIIAIAAMFLCLAASIGAVFYISYDTIEKVMNTAYPGAQISTGGNCSWVQLFKSWGNIFFTVKTHGIPINACESSAFIDLFPLGLLLSLYVLFVKKKRDYILLLLTIVSLIMSWYLFIGMPEIIAKMTGLAFTKEFRVIAVLGVLYIILLFRAMGLCEFCLRRRNAAIISGVFMVCVLMALKEYYGEYFTVGMFVIVMAMAVIISFSVLRGLERNILLGVLMLSLAGGVLVNPVQRGIDIVYQSPFTEFFHEMEQKDDEKWAAVNCSYPQTEYLLLYGLPTVNSVNTYPSMETWRKLDVNGAYEDIYNRYAHIELCFSENKDNEKFELRNPDLFRVNIDINDLKRLDVKYLFSGEKLSEYSGNAEKLQLLNAFGGYYVYEIID